MARKKLLCVTLIALCAILTANCGGNDTKEKPEITWSAENIPLIHLQDSNLYVSDPDSIMQKEFRDTANYYLNRLNRDHGIQSAFIIVKKIKDQDAFRMAQDVGNKYGVGGKESRGGLVVVIATEDKKWFIAPGQGLEGDLPDAVCNQIGSQYIVENMKLHRPNLAVVQTCNAIYNKIKTGKVTMTNSSEEPEDIWSMVLAVGLFATIVIFIRRHIKRKGGSHMGGSSNGNNGDSIESLGRANGRSNSHNHRSSGGGNRGGSYGGGTFGGGGAGGSW